MFELTTYKQVKDVRSILQGADLNTLTRCNVARELNALRHSTKPQSDKRARHLSFFQFKVEAALLGDKPCKKHEVIK